MSYSKLLFDKDNETRISVLSGDPITDVSLLPPFRIYVYRFRSSREAEVFMAGVAVAGGNSAVVDWNPGTSDSNCTVIVGILSEEIDVEASLHERVSFVVVPSGDHDTQAATRAMDLLQAERRAAHERHKAEMTPVLDALARFSPSKPDFGDGWMRTRAGDEIVTVSWRNPKGPFEVDMSASGLFQGQRDRSELIARRALELGLRLGEGRSLEPQVPAPDLASLADTVETLRRATEIIAAEIQIENTADWKATIKMTAARRRFLQAALDDGGARIRTVRAMERARAGSKEEILRAEIDVMLRMEWVVRDGDKLKVTALGAASAQEKGFGNSRKAR